MYYLSIKFKFISFVHHAHFLGVCVGVRALCVLVCVLFYLFYLFLFQLITRNKKVTNKYNAKIQPIFEFFSE